MPTGLALIEKSIQFVSRKQARHELGDISAVTFWRMQKRGEMPPSLSAPGKPLDREKFEEAKKRLAARPVNVEPTE